MFALNSLLFTGLATGFAFVSGRACLRLLGLEESGRDRWITRYLAFPVGLGLLITLLFVLALAGWFTPPVVLALAAILGLASWAVLEFRPPSINNAVESRWGAWLLLGLVVYALLASMAAPLEWDELSYHLPYARDYAQHGGLVVSEYLRYPLHAHNFHLLYASALLYSNEAATHQLHALSGLLVATGIVLYARCTMGMAVAVIAGALYLHLTSSYYHGAYVDLGLGLFVFSAFISLAAWQLHGRTGYLYVSAFMLGMAIGVKYQGLVQLLPFAVALWIDKRSPSLWAGLGATVIVFGSWWYLRNLLISGDPVHPMGAPLFGYWLWNEADLAAQNSNVAGYKHHLPAVLWPAFGAVFFMRGAGAQYRNLVILAGAGLLAWYLSSRYGRYLVPTLPFLAILSGHVIVQAWRKWAPAQWKAANTARYVPVALGALMPVLLAVVLAADVKNAWGEICFTSECIDAVHSREHLTYGVRNSYPGFDELSLYQLGLEGEMYTLGKPLFGDWFGKYRYDHVLSLKGGGAETAAYLRSIGANSLLVTRKRAPFDKYLERQKLEPAMERVYEDENVVLFVLSGP